MLHATFLKKPVVGDSGAQVGQHNQEQQAKVGLRRPGGEAGGPTIIRRGFAFNIRILKFNASTSYGVSFLGHCFVLMLCAARRQADKRKGCNEESVSQKDVVKKAH